MNAATTIVTSPINYVIFSYITSEIIQQLTVDSYFSADKILFFFSVNHWSHQTKVDKKVKFVLTEVYSCLTAEQANKCA